MIDPAGANGRFRRRNLPHWEVDGATYFVTFRLAGSSPAHLEQEWRDERARARSEGAFRMEGVDALRTRSRLMAMKFDQQLDCGEHGPRYLERASIASLVVTSIEFYAGIRYELLCFVVMPNHVHLVFTPLQRAGGIEVWSLDAILRSIKGYSGRQANLQLERSGEFWQREYYDHLIRDGDDLAWYVGYTLNNPVAAGLCDAASDWPCSNARDFEET
jgi:REP element-mobilizing transposase RayT